MERMFDTHAHLNFQAFDPSTTSASLSTGSLRAGDKVDQVIKEANKADISHIMVVGTDVSSSKKAVKIANLYNGVYAAVGIHPHHIFGIMNDELRIKNELEELEKLLAEKKVLAIGEVGMDRHIYQKTQHQNYQISEKFIALQKQAFIAQIKLAIKHQKSLIIHNREAAGETLEILKENWDKRLERRSVFHCCEPDGSLLEFAKKHRVFIGIDGDVTYDKAKQEFVKKIPLKLLVLETDSPFLTPQGLNFPNTPANLSFIAEFIAKILEVDKNRFQEITFQNSQRLFGTNTNWLV